MSPPVPYGNVIEYISDRLYWACYTSPPTSSTPFPPTVIPDPYKIIAPETVRPGSRSPQKRKPNQITNSSGLKPVYFTVDDALLYNPFHHDFGPLHIGHLYRFAVTLHEILGDPRNEGRVVVFWSKPDGKARANAGCLLACYMVLVQSWPPHLALSPLAMCDPPLMPFRDAGYSQADFILSVQDVVYGVWKAKEKGLVNLREFCLDEYEKYERVDMGDFNWVSPNFLAFASPQHKLPPAGQPQPHIPTDEEEILASSLPTPFKNVLQHFYTHDIGLVVRLNSHLYPSEYFTALGIAHMDMIFDDGTCPPLNLVRKFINYAHQTITISNKNIAVHCKAGLGRTGCLIGAYLIYRYGFSANEVIAYMRFMRPGMVVGPQQHWLHLNQDDFRKWWFEDTILAAALEKAASGSVVLRTPTKSKRVSSGHTPTTVRRSILGEVDNNTSESSQAAALPAPTPGQPRKTSSRFASAASSRRVPSDIYDGLDSIVDENDASSSPIRRRTASKPKVDEDELGRARDVGMTEEEYMIRLHRRVATKTPGSKRSTSHTTTTAATVTATTASTVAPIERTTRSTGSGLGTKIRQSPRRREAAASGVRKTSGRQVSGSGPTPPRRAL
ncbi:protein-tyrosine phosphatase-like protein [Sphaerosporella brunnea]|uniref:protein-tyrosine-phosphatase n=1 Tax=Sphaerosporella brunnea TaxID=1250544 RepID=A0A5J5EH76_9PEZI|nr:protein-tyrosine phosphatase-like protein [Sphaerosporella brunnea]